jgi:histidine triad (HIT) family protein/ATP adenylyltransferase
LSAAREPFDIDGYVARSRRGPCFVCAFLAGDPDYRHDLLYDDGERVAFLDRYPTMPGRVIVAPREHLEHVVRDLDRDAYLSLQDVIYRVARAVEAAVPSERTYVLSLGSQKGHLHWIVAPLPPGTPYEEQQFVALMASKGVVNLPAGQTAAIAARIRAHLSPPPGAMPRGAMPPGAVLPGAMPPGSAGPVPSCTTEMS